MKLDKFVVYIILVILLAYLFPAAGSGSMAGLWDQVATYGIALIFFFYGLRLSTARMKQGLKNWKLHLLVQSATFLFFPLLVLIWLPFVRAGAGYDIWLAFFFLAAVPSTVSSSVVMVSLAEGNVPAAIFNASLSGLLGILVTPLWIGAVMDLPAVEFDYVEIYTRLFLEIMLPLGTGISLQRWGHQWALKHANRLSWMDKAIILVIIFKSFTYSFSERLFAGLSWYLLAVICAGVILLFFIIYGLIGWLSSALRLNREDTITAQFCGTKKSLVHGTVFSKILFSGSGLLALILLPLMIFHAFQILVISILAARKNKERDAYDGRTKP